MTRIETAVFPSYEVKPIMPSRIRGISLKMYDFGPKGDFVHALGELAEMCDQYEKWIYELEEKRKGLDKYSETAERHIKNCKMCLARMREGILLLKNDEDVRIAFQYMNLAMLEQQLHYHLPLQKWKETGDNEIELDQPVKVLPDPDKPDTWYDKEHNHYGQWRPFQIAFVLMNLKSMRDRNCNEREIVDLIWFPTGGGKTEAYLGLSAYTIFIRRLMNKEDSGTAIIMRYTLRLLTAQQYERASAMICACESIRQKHSDLFGSNRISIGLWVGGDTTPNRMDEAMSAYSQLMSGKTEEQPSFQDTTDIKGKAGNMHFNSNAPIRRTIARFPELIRLFLYTLLMKPFMKRSPLCCSAPLINLLHFQCDRRHRDCLGMKMVQRSLLRI